MIQEEFNERKKRLLKLQSNKINPYPSKSERNRTIKKIIDNFSQLEKNQTLIIIAGRVMSWRPHGGSTFGQIKDFTGQIQFLFRKDQIGSEKYQLLQLVDVGDFLELKGILFTTKRGEKTLQVKNFSFLTKTLRPLPAKWHGLKDIEKRFRQRYLDLIINSAVKETFLIRSKIIEHIRQLLIGKDYFEVETPILQPLYGGGFARPFKTHHNTLNFDLYLRISNELYLKRLIVGGWEKIFEFCKDFRNEGMDLTHNPEFTMLEIMTAYQDYRFSMDLVEEIYETLAQKLTGQSVIDYQGQKINFQKPWKRLTMIQAVKKFTDFDFNQIINLSQAKKIGQELGLEKEDLDHSNSVGEILALISEKKVEPQLIQPTIIYDYPVETSPLAKKCSANPKFVERFEHFIVGQEQGNHYSELNDPIDLKQRFIEEKKKEKTGFTEAHQTDNDYLEAIEHGMPPTTGIGIGIDRMVMLFTNNTSIKEVIFFPTMKPKH